MSNHISSIRVNLPDIIASVDLSFNKSLNFISGENGTGKSKVLGFIKDNIGNIGSVVETSDSQPISPDRIAFYNPKRSNQKREIQGLLANMNRESRNIQTLRAQLNQSYADQSFVEYPAFADLFVSAVDDTMRNKDKSPTEAVEIIKKEIDLVIGKVMPHLKAEASWNSGAGEASLMLGKYGRNLTPTQLSVGENEILSLALSIYFLRESNDVYLIDEPEVHLNWSLEKQLFDYLKWFADNHSKQLIVVTHSPVVFEDKFSGMSQFLSWDNNIIVASNSPSENISNKLASRVAATFVAIDVAYDKTFFVEDNAHSMVVQKLGEVKKKNLRIVIVGSKSKLVYLHNAFEPRLANAIFMADGDNEDAVNAGFTDGLFALKKYCIENYLLDTTLLSKVSLNPRYNTKLRVEKLIVTKTQAHRNRNFLSRYKAYIELSKVDKKRFFRLLDTMDGSEFISGMGIYKELGFTNLSDFIDAYIDEAKQTNKLSTLFKEITDKF